MCDLDQFRGKRALVCGIPRNGTKTQQAWLDATDKAMRALGIVKAESFGILRFKSLAVTRFKECAVVLIAGSGPSVGTARHYASLADIPVLRVRRDGSVEVDNA